MNAKRREGFIHKRNLSSLAQFAPVALVLATLLASVPAAESAESDSAAKDEKAASFLREHQSDVVLIKGKTGAGSGFILTRGGRKFLASNAHVMAGIRSPTFNSVDRTPLKFKPGTASVAVGHDIILLELEPGSNGIPVIESFEEEVAVNDPIVVYGNTGGSDVATAINGKLIGIGPNRIEINAEIEHGNSGSPIVHLRTGKVIGVASFATTEDLLSGKTKVRRFGYRLDTVKQWQPVDWGRFYAEADRLEKAEDTTSELRKAFLELNGLNQRTNKVRLYAYESPVIRTALDKFYVTLDEAQDQRGANRAINNLLGTLRDVSKSEPITANSGFTYEYFRRLFAEDEGERKEIMGLFVKILQK